MPLGSTIGGITHQLRRGTSTQMSLFTGAQGEPTFDTVANRMVVHDAVTMGGWAVESAGVQIVNSTGGVTQVLQGVAMVYVFGSTAAVTSLTLPSVIAYPTGQFLTVVDAAANASAAAGGISINTFASSEAIENQAGNATSTNILSTLNGQIVRFRAASTFARWVGTHKV